jgi:UDP-3-O-[3-hydroxymyristoyl] glucosamine N-acyltransferase
MTQLELLENLEKLQIEFNLVHNLPELNDKELKLASFKAIIPQGIYYAQNISILEDVELSNSVLLVSEIAKVNNCTIIQVKNPQLTHYKLAKYFAINTIAEIHPTAIISEKADIGKNVTIGPYSVIGNCKIGNNTIIKNHVVIEDKVALGENVFIDSNSVIGAGGLAWIWDEKGERIIQPQLGGVIIEDDCILATDITVVKGSLSENTHIGKGSVIAHGTKIGHGSQIGEYVHMANNVSLAGNSQIGDYSFLGSACVISSNISIPPHSIVGAAALVNKSFDEKYLTLGGVPAKVIRKDNYKNKPKGAPQPFKKEDI